VIAIGLVAAIIMMIGVYLAGIADPHLLIGTGVEQFQGEVRELAQTLYEQVAPSLEGGEDELPVSALKVKSAERCPGPGPKVSDHNLPPGARDDPDFAVLLLQPRVKGEVEAYTIFGLPIDTIRVHCEEH